MMNSTPPSLVNNTPLQIKGGASGVYVHIPFCAAKCYYCDFVSAAIGIHPNADRSEKIEAYLAALRMEAALYGKLLCGGEGAFAKTGSKAVKRAVKKAVGKIGDQDGGEAVGKAVGKDDDQVFWESLYLGGGTPTILSAEQLFSLLASLRQVFPLTEDAEVTVEGNPGTIDQFKLEALKNQGCTRLSLGVQSFADSELSLLGRIHTGREAEGSFRLARRAGFANINLDLMYGLPQQRLKDWRQNLLAAVDLGPEHLSLYQLNIEKGTPFFTWQSKGLLPEFAEEEALAMYEEAIDYLTGAGYRHYEIGNFAKPGYESRHNQSYWKNREYVGLGAGASGYLAGVRYSNYTEPADYAAALIKGERPLLFTESIDFELAMSEMMFLGLRLLDGVGKQEFFQRFGRTIFEQYGKAIDKLKRQGLLEETAQAVKLTRKGLYLANVVMLEFV